MVYLSICLCHFDFFHQYLILSVCLFVCLFVFEYRSFASLARFILRYFILFDKTVNGIVSLISFSDLPLLVYKKARDLCVLVLYSVTLSTSLMSSSSFLVASFVFFYV